MSYDATTEVLTSNGWIRWPDVSVNHRLFSVDVATGVGEFSYPFGLHQRDFVGELYCLSGQQLDICVTADHLMIAARRKNATEWHPISMELAHDCAGHSRRYLTAASTSSGIAAPYSTQFMSLLGFFIGDGYADASNRVSFHLKKQRKIDYLLGLDVGIKPYAANKYALRGSDFDFRTLYSPKKEKRIPDWVLSVSPELQKAFMDGLRNSDGSARRNTWVYCTTSIQVADTLQALLHMNGQSCSFSHTNYGHPEKVATRVNVSDRVSPRVELSCPSRRGLYDDEWLPYTGVVYGATLPTNAVMVRRNAHVVVSGSL